MSRRNTNADTETSFNPLHQVLSQEPEIANVPRSAFINLPVDILEDSLLSFLSPQELVFLCGVNKSLIPSILIALFLMTTEKAVTQQKQLLRRESMQFLIVNDRLRQDIIRKNATAALLSPFSSYSHKLAILGFLYKMHYGATRLFIEEATVTFMMGSTLRDLNNLEATPITTTLNLLAPHLSQEQVKEIIVNHQLLSRLQSESAETSMIIVSLLATKLLPPYDSQITEAVLKFLTKHPAAYNYSEDNQHCYISHISWPPLVSTLIKASEENVAESLLSSMIEKQLSIISRDHMHGAKKATVQLREYTKLISAKQSSLIATQLLSYALTKNTIFKSAPSCSFYYGYTSDGMGYALEIFTVLAAKCKAAYPVVITNAQLSTLLSDLLRIKLRNNGNNHRIIKLFGVLAPIFSEAQIIMITNWMSNFNSAESNRVLYVTLGIASRLSPEQLWSNLLLNLDSESRAVVVERLGILTNDILLLDILVAKLSINHLSSLLDFMRGDNQVSLKSCLNIFKSLVSIRTAKQYTILKIDEFIKGKMLSATPLNQQERVDLEHEGLLYLSLPASKMDLEQIKQIRELFVRHRPLLELMRINSLFNIFPERDVLAIMKWCTEQERTDILEYLFLSMTRDFYDAQFNELHNEPFKCNAALQTFTGLLPSMSAPQIERLITATTRTIPINWHTNTSAEYELISNFISALMVTGTKQSVDVSPLLVYSDSVLAPVIKSLPMLKDIFHPAPKFASLEGKGRSSIPSVSST